MITEQDLFTLAKTAGGRDYAAATHARRCCCAERPDLCDCWCPKCKGKTAAEEEKEPEKLSLGQRVKSIVTDGASKAVMGLGAAATGLASLGKPAPPQKVDPRYNFPSQ